MLFKVFFADMSDSSSFAELFEGMEGFLADDDSPTIAGGGADREQSQVCP